MKISFLCLLTLALSLSACDNSRKEHAAKAAQEKADKAVQRSEAQMKQAQTLSAQARKMMEASSIPGEIVLNGAMVLEPTGEHTKDKPTSLDPRIKVSLQSGRSGEKVESKSLNAAEARRFIRQTTQVHESVLATFEKIEKGTDLVIGCDTQDEIKALLSSLRKPKIKSEEVVIAQDLGVHLLIADRVILCGSMVPGGITLIEANELILADFNLNTTGIGLPVQIFAGKLTLIGRNHIAVKGLPSSEQGNSGGGIQITLASPIEGAGELELLSEGGDRLRTGFGRR